MMDSFDRAEVQRLVNRLKNVVSDLHRSAAITDMVIERIECRLNGGSTEDQEWDKFMLNRYIECMNTKSARRYYRLEDREHAIWYELLKITGADKL
jgi:hypothetical protein